MSSETPVHFTIRRQIIEFAALPASKWLPAEDGSAAVQTLLQQLLDVSIPDSFQRRAPITPPSRSSPPTFCRNRRLPFDR